MNIFFWILVVLILFIVWVAAVRMFIPIGRLANKVSKKVSDTINYEEEQEGQEEKKDESR